MVGQDKRRCDVPPQWKMKDTWMKTRMPAGTTVTKTSKLFHGVFSRGEIEDRRRVRSVKEIYQAVERFIFRDHCMMYLKVFECIFSQDNIEHCSTKILCVL